MRYPRLRGRPALIEVRCSKEEQAATSIPDQKRLLTAFAAEHEMPVADIIELAGVSGSAPAIRTDIQQIIDRKRTKNDFDVLLVQDSSRFTRAGAKHASKIEFDLNGAGIEVVFVADNLPDSDWAEVIKAANATAATHQVKMAAFISLRGRMSKMQAGKLPHSPKPPYGIDRLYVGPEGPRCIIRLLHDGTQVQLHPETKAVIRRFDAGPKNHYVKQADEHIELVPGDPEILDRVRDMFRLKLIEGWGYHRIASKLNCEGVPTPMGRSLWWRTTVMSVLTNPIYTGFGTGRKKSTARFFQMNPDEPKPANVSTSDMISRPKPPVIMRDRSEWFHQPHPHLDSILDPELKAVVIAWQTMTLDKPADPKYRRDRHTESQFFLKHILTSAQGGYRMTGIASGRTWNPSRYYKVTQGVSAPLGKGSVLAKLIPATEMEMRVLDCVQRVLANMGDIRCRLLDAVQREVSEHAGSEDSLNKLVDERDALEERAGTIALDGMGPNVRKAVQRRLDKIEQEISDLNRRIDVMRAGLSGPKVDPVPHVEGIMKRLARLRDSISDFPPASIRQVLKLLVSKLVVDLETREVSLELALPKSAVMDPSFLDLNVCVEQRCHPSALLEAHRGNTRITDVVPHGENVVVLGSFHCTGTPNPGRWNPFCLTCHRRAA